MKNLRVNFNEKLILSDEMFKLYDRLKFLLSNYVEILLYRLEDYNIGFSLVLVESENPDMFSFLKDNKRDTDILMRVYDNKNLHILICQDTDIEGAFAFSGRLVKLIEKNSIFVNTSKVSIVNCENFEDDTKKVIYKLMDEYHKLKSSNTSRWVTMAKI
ncbi:hypothetical protein [Nitrosophilus kaiyonis]|uniref:hypothetical protein n=1 Tax=Nitrosophilus kaiyonis TaxID=2930200 RepID=UPI0024925E96|nr:hypothetical protein [Nitrosophilus kaiyonis]